MVLITVNITELKPWGSIHQSNFISLCRPGYRVPKSTVKNWHIQCERASSHCLLDQDFLFIFYYYLGQFARVK